MFWLLDNRRAVQYARSLGFRVCAHTLHLHSAKKARCDPECGDKADQLRAGVFDSPTRLLGQFWRQRVNCDGVRPTLLPFALLIICF